VLSGRGLCDELITRPEESYRLWCVVVCDLETSRIGAPYVYDISNLRVNCVRTHKRHSIITFHTRLFVSGINVATLIALRLAHDIALMAAHVDLQRSVAVVFL